MQVLPEDSNSTGSSAAEETTTDGETEAEGAEEEGEGEAEAEEAEAGVASGGARVELRGVRARCPRTPQCAPNPCRSGGACEDHWTSYLCTCPRPHLGDTCQYSK